MSPNATLSRENRTVRSNIGSEPTLVTRNLPRARGLKTSGLGGGGAGGSLSARSVLQPTERGRRIRIQERPRGPRAGRNMVLHRRTPKRGKWDHDYGLGHWP